MTEQTQTELYDPLDGGSGGGGNYAPTISWPNFKRQKVTGLILPDSSTGSEKPYRVAPQTKQGTRDILYFDAEQKRPRTQLEFTLLTDLRDWQGTSDQFQERQAEKAGSDEERTDDGRRRVIVKGKPMTEQLSETLKAAGVPKNARGNYIPEVGGTLSVTWLKKVDIGDGKTQNVFEMSYQRATPASAQKAREFAASVAPAVEGDELDGPAASTTSAGSDDPPY